MVFSSLVFLFRFLPAVLLLYYLAPKNLRNFVLFVSSLFFYAWGEPVYVLLILFSTVVDYTAGRMVAYYKEKDNMAAAGRMVFCSAVINLSLLGFFKYGNFFLQNIHRFFSVPVPDLGNLALPIGISFYTFQTMSYTIDVYRGDAKVQKNFIAFGAYVALFPQLIAGPIIRYKTVAKQLQKRAEGVDLFYRGVLRFVTGLGKKVLLANQVGVIWDEIAGMKAESLTTAAAWLGVLAFTLQIYFDFSGYSDMALGLGAMFGFHFPENFNYPYESKSITEFWRRWHISLGTWFKEYVYIPLGGNRKGLWRQIFNIGLVWFLTGLWHGAAWNFILWGVYYGVLLVLEKLVWKPCLEKLPALLQHVYTMCIVMIGWSLFSWPDMAERGSYMKALFFDAQAGIVNQQANYIFCSNLLFLLIALIACTSLPKRFVMEKCLPEGSKRRGIAGGVFVLAMMLACIAMLVNNSYNPFLYFRF